MNFLARSMRKVNTIKQLEELLGIGYDRIKFITDNIDNFYRPARKEVKMNEFGIPKLDKEGREKYRILHPSKKDLKHIQNILKSRIFSTYEFPVFIQGGVKGKSNVSNAKLHKGKKYKFLTDLNAFFPSITHKRVYETLKDVGFYPEIASLITKLTTFKGHLPQGTPTSSYIANLVFLKTENKFIPYCQEHDITYSRFIDDLTFSAQYDFKNITSEFIHIIRNDEFRISFDKTSFCTIADITGVKTFNNFLDTTDKFKAKHSDRSDYSNQKKSSVDSYERRIQKS